MASKHLSVRLDDSTFERLNAVSRRTGQTRSQLAKTLLDEGLRMERHPGIVFRSGPAGRRPALIDGPDIWEIARVSINLDERGEALITRAADITGLDQSQIRTALRYYAEFSDEIDEWIRRVDEEAEEAEAAWLREQHLLNR